VTGPWFGGGARLLPLDRRTDARGALLPLDFDRLPFVPRRVFAVHGVPRGAVRGGHGHRAGHQLLVCLHGRVRVRLRDARETFEVTLDPGGAGLLVGPGLWGEQTYLVEGSVLLVLASEPYDPASYFREPGGGR
jgi:dTDP-4-dehydrorhamnose 3,5-epimerase-like enzyme